jgi:hypothetical protein
MDHGEQTLRVIGLQIYASNNNDDAKYWAYDRRI